MVPADVENYLANIARVLAPGGTSFTTYYLLNEATRQSTVAEGFCYPVDTTGVCQAVSKVEFEKGGRLRRTFHPRRAQTSRTDRRRTCAIWPVDNTRRRSGVPGHRHRAEGLMQPGYSTNRNLRPSPRRCQVRH